MKEYKNKWQKNTKEIDKIELINQEEFLINHDKTEVSLISSIDYDNCSVTLQIFDLLNNKENLKEKSFSEIQKNYLLINKTSEIEIGSSVILNQLFFKEDTMDSPFNILGKITDTDGYWAYVDWENGKFNTYRLSDADLLLI